MDIFIILRILPGKMFPISNYFKQEVDLMCFLNNYHIKKKKQQTAIFSHLKDETVHNPFFLFRHNLFLTVRSINLEILCESQHVANNFQNGAKVAIARSRWQLNKEKNKNQA